MHFYLKNGFNGYSKVVNIFLRTIVTVLAAIALYYVYYKTAHLFLGTQKGFSHPQQFPMIPLIWFINVMLINYWFMDGWPGWRLAKAGEVVKVHRVEENGVLTTSFYKGAIGGIVGGIAVYFAIIYLLPTMGKALTIF